MPPGKSGGTGQPTLHRTFERSAGGHGDHAEIVAFGWRVWQEMLTTNRCNDRRAKVESIRTKDTCMKTCIPLDCVLLVGILSSLAASETRAERVPEPTLERAESRLRDLRSGRVSGQAISRRLAARQYGVHGDRTCTRWEGAGARTRRCSQRQSNGPGPAAERNARPIRRDFPRWPEHTDLRTGESVCA